MSGSPSLDAFAAAKLRDLEAQSLRRRLTITDPTDGAMVERNGRQLLNFSSNDYLGLNHHPALAKAAAPPPSLASSSQ